MSATNQVFLCLLGLGLTAGGVGVWAIWPTPRKVAKAARAVERHRRGDTVARVEPKAPEAEGVEPAEPVLADEPVEETAPESGGEPASEPDSEPATAPEPAEPFAHPYPEEPSWWAEPTPFAASAGTEPGVLPDPPFFLEIDQRFGPSSFDLESLEFTRGWHRAERAELKRALDMEPEEYGERAA